MRPYFEKDGVRLFHGDCREVLAALEDSTFHAVVTDPPYGLSAPPDMATVLRAWLAGEKYEHGKAGFMGREWDSFVPGPETWRECVRVLKPGGHVLSFFGTRTYDMGTVAMRLAGLEVRDMLQWLYGQGFPKSLDVSKAIDKQRDDRDDILRVTCFMADAAERRGISRADVDAHMGTSDMGGWWLSRLRHRCQCPTWEQWVRLKALLAMSDAMDGEVQRLNARKGSLGEAWQAAPVIGHQTKARSESGASALPTLGAATLYKTWDVKAPNSEAAKQWEGWGTALRPGCEPLALARKPLSGTVARNVLAHGAGALNVKATRLEREDADAGWPANILVDEAVARELGEAARYFYCPKPTAAERGAANNHPTLKPLDLMRYLCRLVTPRGGLLLDPYAGSGTTLIAARKEGFRAVGVEMEEAHCEIIAKRLEHGAGMGADADEPGKPRQVALPL